MWGRAKTALAIIGFLALFGFLAFQIGVASKYPPRHSEQATGAQDHEQRNVFERFWEWTTDDPVAVYTLVLAISTIGLWIVTAQGARDGKRAANIAEQALTKLERAFVFSETCQASNIRDGVTDRTVAWQFQVKWQNSGSTPARNVLLHTSWEHFPGDIPADFAFPDYGVPDTVPSYIAPRSSTLSLPLGIDVSVIHGVMQGHFRLFFWGWITYDDIFENTPHHVTRFCWELAQVSRDPYLVDGQNTYFRFNVHPRWNCIDEDCGA